MSTKGFISKTSKFFYLMAMTLCLTLTSCDELTEDETSFDSYIDINITRCERVGGVLMFDFTVTNKKSNGLDVELSGLKVVDNTGASYSGNTATISLGNQEYWFYSSGVISSKGSIKGHAKIPDFDPANRSENVTISMDVSIEGIPLENATFTKKKIAFVDNRVMDHGVQTNDTNLSYHVTSCQFNGNNVYMEFTVTNNTGLILTDFGMGYAYGGEAKVFDNNNVSYDSSVKFGDDDWYHFASVDRFAAGGTTHGTLWVKNVRSGATELNVYIGVGAENYVFEDQIVRFLNIPMTE